MGIMCLLLNSSNSKVKIADQIALQRVKCKSTLLVHISISQMSLSMEVGFISRSAWLIFLTLLDMSLSTVFLGLSTCKTKLIFTSYKYFWNTWMFQKFSETSQKKKKRTRLQIQTTSKGFMTLKNYYISLEFVWFFCPQDTCRVNWMRCLVLESCCKLSPTHNGWRT